VLKAECTVQGSAPLGLGVTSSSKEAVLWGPLKATLKSCSKVAMFCLHKNVKDASLQHALEWSVLTSIGTNRLKVVEENKLGNFEVTHSLHFEHAAFHIHHTGSHAATPTYCRCLNILLTSRWLCIVIYSYNKTNYMHYFLKFIFRIKIYIFRTVALSTIRSFSLYTQQWCMSHGFCWQLSANLYDIHHCCVYSEKLLMVDRGTVRNM